MIGYITLGTNDLAKSVAFYDQVFGELSCKKVHEYDRFVGWNIANDQLFAVVKPFNQEKATYGNGTMIAIKVSDEKMVRAVHAKVLDQGGTSEGDPGIRQGTYFCGYCRDLDGNKLNFYCHI